ncbi:MAG: hypothetical protein ACAF42_07980 [Limnothrix sp. BL-A-16]|jgi:hypothetical protein
MFPNSSNPNPLGGSGSSLPGSLPGSPTGEPGGDRYGTGLVAPQSVDARTKKLMQRTFLILLLAGLAIGAVISVGVVIAFQKFGLVGVPTPSTPIAPGN